MIKGLDAKYDADTDHWILKVPYGLTVKSVDSARIWIRGLWLNELRSLNPFTNADKHAFVAKAIKALDEGRIKQVVVGKEATVFQSNQKENPHRSIFV